MKYTFKDAGELMVGDVLSDGATVVKINRAFGRVLVMALDVSKPAPDGLYCQQYRKRESVQVQG